MTCCDLEEARDHSGAGQSTYLCTFSATAKVTSPFCDLGEGGRTLAFVLAREGHGLWFNFTSGWVDITFCNVEGARGRQVLLLYTFSVG
jgi:hypothetical protein